MHKDYIVTGYEVSPNRTWCKPCLEELGGYVMDVIFTGLKTETQLHCDNCNKVIRTTIVEGVAKG